MRRVLVFDVNETLLDLGPIRRLFADRFGDVSLAGVWFGQLLRLALVSTIVGEHHTFATMAGTAFDMTAAARGLDAQDGDRETVLSSMRSLPPHPDVTPAFETLAEAGFRMAALTNSPPDTARAQLENAGLASFLEKILTVEAVGVFKPDARVYRAAATELGVSAADMRMIAAHDWDVYGAMRAGCAAAFVARPGMVLNPLQPPVDVVGRDLIEVADKIIALESG
jgi:2-haloacid dehalogenase